MKKQKKMKKTGFMNFTIIYVKNGNFTLIKNPVANRIRAVKDQTKKYDTKSFQIVFKNFIN
jgi:hypothetical protein